MEEIDFIQPKKIVDKLISVDVLDKIKAEIEQNAYPIVHGVNNHELGMTLYGILEVIDLPLRYLSSVGATVNTSTSR